MTHSLYRKLGTSATVGGRPPSTSRVSEPQIDDIAIIADSGIQEAELIAQIREGVSQEQTPSWSGGQLDRFLCFRWHGGRSCFESDVSEIGLALSLLHRACAINP